jgi:hypothetical protein
MYAIGTATMAEALSLDFLGFVPPIFLAAGLGGWVLVLAGWLVHVVQHASARTER